MEALSWRSTRDARAFDPSLDTRSTVKMGPTLLVLLIFLLVYEYHVSGQTVTDPSFNQTEAYEESRRNKHALSAGWITAIVMICLLAIVVIVVVIVTLHNKQKMKKRRKKLSSESLTDIIASYHSPVVDPHFKESEHDQKEIKKAKGSEHEPKDVKESESPKSPPKKLSPAI